MFFCTSFTSCRSRRPPEGHPHSPCPPLYWRRPWQLRCMALWWDFLGAGGMDDAKPCKVYRCNLSWKGWWFGLASIKSPFLVRFTWWSGTNKLLPGQYSVSKKNARRIETTVSKNECLIPFPVHVGVIPSRLASCFRTVHPSRSILAVQSIHSNTAMSKLLITSTFYLYFMGRQSADTNIGISCGYKTCWS